MFRSNELCLLQIDKTKYFKALKSYTLSITKRVIPHSHNIFLNGIFMIFSADFFFLFEEISEKKCSWASFENNLPDIIGKNTVMKPPEESILRYMFYN